MESLSLKPGEQLDNLLNGRQIIQDPKRFMFGIDAVLLSSFAVPYIRANDNIIDLGTGTGIIPLLLETRTLAKSFTALEVQHDSFDMANRSVEINNLTSKINVVEGDIKNVSSLFPKHSFTCVTTNPPYMINNHGRKNCNDAKTIARHEILCNLEDIISAVDYLLAPFGKFFMIHRPFRLAEIINTMKNHKIEVKRLQLIQPMDGKEANIVLIEGRKNAQERVKIEPTLNVYKSKGVYSDEVQSIYNQIADPPFTPQESKS